MQVVTPEIRTQILQLTIALYNAAPGAKVQADLEALFVAGASLSDIAAALDKTDTFKSLYPATLTNVQLATQFVETYIGSEASAAAKADLVTWATAQLNAGDSPGSMMQVVNDALAGSNEARWANAQKAFANKTDVANSYTLEVASGEGSLAALTAAINGVTSAASTVTAAKAITAANVNATADVATATAAIAAETTALAAALATDATALTTAATTAAATASTDLTAKLAADSALVTAQATFDAATSATLAAATAALSTAKANSTAADTAATASAAASAAATTAADAATAADATLVTAKAATTAASAAAKISADKAALAASSSITDTTDDAAAAAAVTAADAAVATVITAATVSSIAAATAATDLATAVTLTAAEATAHTAAAATDAAALTAASTTAAANAAAVPSDAALQTAAVLAKAAADSATAADAAAVAAAAATLDATTAAVASANAFTAIAALTTTDATDDAAAVTAVNAAVAQAATSAAATVTAAIIPGTTFTLTTAADNFTGSTGNDTFNAALDDNTAANNTLSVTDILAGGEGTDTLNITVDTSAAGVALPSSAITGIEVFNLRNVSGQTLTVNAQNMTGETQLWADRATSQVTLTNVEEGTTVGIRGDAAITNAATSATYAAAATTGSLAVAGGTLGANAITMNGAGLTTIAISSTGAANTIGALGSNSALLTGVSIDATNSLATGGITIASNTAITTEALTVSGAATNVAATATVAETAAVVLGAIDTDFGSVDASGLTAGGVSATLSATLTATFTGGLGNDTITTSTSAQTGAVKGGAGTDTLVLANTVDIDTTAEGAIYTEFETLAVNGTDIDMDLMTGSTITSVSIGASTSEVTDMTAAQAGAVVFAGAIGTTTLGVKNASNVGTSDTLAITVSDGDTTTSEAVMATGVLTIAGVETITVNAVDDLVVTSMLGVTGLGSLTVSGAGNASITTLAQVLGTNTTIDFSGLSGANAFNAAGATTNAFAFTGGTGVDAVVDNVVSGNVLDLGAGNDTLTLTAKTSTAGGVTTVNGGAGADIITYNQIGNDTADGTVLFQYAAGDSVSDTSTTGISATLTDIITTMSGDTLATAAGTSAEFDTEVQATAITFGAAANPTFGTTTVTNAGDFYINIASAGVTNIYQDTDGDGIIESGEFAITLTGIATNTLVNADFTITSGDLIMATT